MRSDLVYTRASVVVQKFTFSLSVDEGDPQAATSYNYMSGSRLHRSQQRPVPGGVAPRTDISTICVE